MSAAKGVKDSHCTQTYRNYTVLQQLHMSWRKSRKEGKKTNAIMILFQERQKQERVGPEMTPSSTWWWNGSWEKRGCHLGLIWGRIKKIIPSYMFKLESISSHSQCWSHGPSPPKPSPDNSLPRATFFLWCKLKTEPEALPANSKYRKHNYIGCGFLTSKTILQIFKGVTMCKANLKKDS